MCTMEDHSVYAAKGQITVCEAHALVNDTRFTRFSLTNCFLLISSSHTIGRRWNSGNGSR